MAALQTVTGTVRVVKGAGFQLAGRDGWLNVSKFADPKPELPEPGQRVTCGLDAKGFVRALEPEASAPASSAPPAPPTPHVERPAGTLEARVAALQAASTYLAGNPDAKYRDVLAVAERFAAWLEGR